MKAPKKKEAPKVVKEVRLEDKVLLINPNQAEDRVYIMHQYAGKLFRTDLTLAVKKFIHGFEDIDVDGVLD